jgi:hypothetical protein
MFVVGTNCRSLLDNLDIAAVPKLNPNGSLSLHFDALSRNSHIGSCGVTARKLEFVFARLTAGNRNKNLS